MKAKEDRNLYTLPETLLMLLSEKLAMIDGKGRSGSDAASSS